MNKNNRALILLLCVAAISAISIVRAQRDNDNDDFDDSGFDDSGYSNSNGQPSRDAEESNQNPSNYSPANNEEDLDDDDDVDETRSNSRISQQPTMQMRRQQQQRQQQQQQQYYGNVAPQPFYAPPNSVLLAGFDPSQQIYNGAGHQNRYRRSVATENSEMKEKDIEDVQRDETNKSLSRRKRYAKHSKKSYIGPVYTYVKTDKHAHYKWGVKHKVGKQYGR